MGFWDTLSNNPFIGALVSGLAILLVGWLISIIIKQYQANRVYEILRDSLKEKNKTFLPTAYLSAETGYTQSRVEALCSFHGKIRRNEKELESWRIV